MKKIAVLLLSVSLFNIQSFAQESDHHKGHHQPQAATQVKSDKKFVADDNLKSRMGAVLDAVKALEAAGVNKNKNDSVIEAGKKIEATVNDIFKTCKLEPDADAAIHPILADLLKGASFFKKGNAKEGHEKIHKALLKYEETFEHAGWGK